MKILSGHSGWLTEICWAGNKLISHDSDDFLYVWNLSTGLPELKVRVETAWQYKYDEDMLVYADWDQHVYLRRISASVNEGTIPYKGERINQLDSSFYYGMLALISESDINVFSLSTGELMFKKDDQIYTHCSWAEEQRVFITHEKDGTIGIWDFTSWTKKAYIQLPQPAHRIQVSPSGEIVCLGWESGIYVLDLEDII